MKNLFEHRDELCTIITNFYLDVNKNDNYAFCQSAFEYCDYSSCYLFILENSHKFSVFILYSNGGDIKANWMFCHTDFISSNFIKECEDIKDIGFQNVDFVSLDIYKDILIGVSDYAICPDMEKFIREYLLS